MRPREFATSTKSGLALETLQRSPAAAQPGGAAAPLVEPAGAHYQPVPELEGEWAMVSCIRDGMPVEKKLLPYGKRVDRANQVTVSFGPQVMFKARYSVDGTKQSKTIDFTHAEGVAAGQTQLGIYEVEGDRLKLCYAAPGSPRPENYETAPADGKTMAVWRRLK